MQSMKKNIGTIIKLIILGAFFYYPLFSQTKKEPYKPSPSSRDSLGNPTQTMDSLEIEEIYSVHNHLGNYGIEESQLIQKNSIQKINYYTLNDILYEKLNIYPLTTGSLASTNNFQIHGARINEFQMNGRALRSGLSSFNGFFISPEAFETIEVLTGIDAVLMSNNASGAVLNVQERRFDTKDPYVRIWIGEGMEDFNGADVVLSQNFAPNWNGTINISGTGDPYFYQNSGFEAWKLHSKFRHQLSDNSSFSFAFMHDHKIEGLFGGLDPNLSLDPNRIFSTDPVDAVSLFSSTNRREIRNELNFTFSSLLDSTGNKINITAYYSNSELRNLRSEEFQSDSLDPLFYINSNNYAGFNAFIKNDLSNNFDYLSGLFIDYEQISFTPYTNNQSNLDLGAYSKINYNISSKTRLGGGIRTGLNNDNFFINIGFEINQNLLSHQLKFDISRSNLLINNYLTQNKIEDHHLAKFSINDSSHIYGIEAFYRRISNDVYYTRIESEPKTINLQENISDNSRYGVSAYFNKEFKTNIIFDSDAFWIKLFLNTNLSTINDQQLEELPLLNGSIDFAYIFDIGRSSLKAGTKFQFTSGSNGLSYHPLFDQYYFYGQNIDPMLDLMDLYLIFKLGRAHLKLTVTNLLGSQNTYLAWYPVLNTNVRITASWTIID